MSESTTTASSASGAARVTWAALLAHWTRLAQTALALPTDGPGQRLRASVPDLITLQAVWFALQDLGQLDHDERALGLDKAERLIRRHAEELVDRWGKDDLPPIMAEMIDDAWKALQMARLDGEEPAPESTP